MKVQGYERDEIKVKGGAPVRIGRNKDGTSRIIVVRPLNSHAYEEALKFERKGVRLRSNDDDVAREFQIRAMAKVVLVEIINFQTPEGEPIASTLENKIELLRGGAENSDPALWDRDFFMEVFSASTSAETFAREEVETDLGNSQSTSSGG